MWRANFHKREKLVRHKGIAKTDAKVSRVNEDGPGFKTLHPMAGAPRFPSATGKVARTIPLDPG
jgi:hypothetical protein